MTRLKWLLAILAGTFAYIILSFAYGKNGIFAYRQLQEQKSEISIHTAAIQRINDELFLEYTALQNDSEVIAAYARKLDYIASGEKLVKITGLRPAETKIYDTGTVLRRKEVEWLPEAVCKAAGFCVFLFFSLIFIIISFFTMPTDAKLIKQKRESVAKKEIPVYDLPQI